jgi:hypothetical protein
MWLEINLDDEFKNILLLIQKENKSEANWAEVESCDMFQSHTYCGGFDATEMEFCFSYYSKPNEYWFQFKLTAVDEFLRNSNAKLSMQLASK